VAGERLVEELLKAAADPEDPVDHALDGQIEVGRKLAADLLEPAVDVVARLRHRRKSW
jgi:hypothetical protein